MHYVSRLCWRGKKKRIALEGHLLHHVVISHGSLLGDTSSLMMLQVHKVTPWLVKCEPEKLMSLPGLNLTLESCEKCLLFSRKLAEQERCDASRLLTSQTALSPRRWTFIVVSWAATKNRRISRVRRCSWMFWCVTARDAQARSLTRLASTQSQSIAQKARSKLFQVFSSAGVVTCERPSVGGVWIHSQRFNTVGR